MTDGDEVTTGTLYRLIRPTKDCWVNGHHTSKIFRKDGDVGISMLIASERVYEKILERWPDYGVCSIEVERLRDVPPPDPKTIINPKKAPRDDRVFVRRDPDEFWGDDHVLVVGITARLRDWICGLAVIVREPQNIREPIP